MKKLICEMCGSADMLKKEGVFECQSCGCKYSVEEAKKMMVEGTVEVQGIVKVDNSEALTNYLELARIAIDSENYDDAENYINKIMELDTKNAFAWEVKGTVAGWLSSGNNNRTKEMFACWDKSLSLVSPEDRETLGIRIEENFMKISSAMLISDMRLFCIENSDENYERVINDLHFAGENINKLILKYNLQFTNETDKNDLFATIISDNIQEIDFDYVSFDEAHNIMKLSEYAYDMSRSEFIIENTYDSYCLARDCYDEQNPYMVVDSVQERVRNNNEKFARLKDNRIDNTISEKLLKKYQANRIKNEEKMAIEEYWKNNSEEKNRIDAAINDANENIKKLNEQIQGLESEINQYYSDNKEQNIPEENKIDELKTQIVSLTEYSSGLGFFKGKEKKETEQKINSIYNEIDALNRRVSAIKEEKQKEIDKEISVLREQIIPIRDEIRKNNEVISRNKSELSKSRGRIEDSTNSDYTNGFDCSLKSFEKLLLLKCNEIFDGYSLQEVDFDSDWSDSEEYRQYMNELGNQWYMGIVGSYSVVLFADKESKVSAIDLQVDEYHYTGKSDDSEKGIEMLFKAGVTILRALIKDISETKAENLILDMLFSANVKSFQQGNILVECLNDYSKECFRDVIIRIL